MVPRRRWSRRRGTAMVEFAIVAPLLVLVWAGIDYMRDRALAAQRALHASRTQAWSAATSGACRRDATPSPLLAVDFGSFGTEAVGAFAVFASRGSILQATATVDARATQPGPSPSPILSLLGPPRVLEGRTYLPCNDALPRPRGTVLPALLPLGAKELSP